MAYRARIIFPAELTQNQIECIGVPFEEQCLAHVALREENHSQSPWILEWYFETAPKQPDLDKYLRIGIEIAQTQNIETNWEIEEIPENIDWLEHSYKQFQPFSVREFFIYGSHYDGQTPTTQIGLQIDAATAFGSGEHGTTAGCLEALQDLKDQGVCPWNILDMGTGSGILAIASYKLWKTPVFAVDNDPESINVTRRHLKFNDISESKHDILCAVNQGFEGDAISKRGPFELIIANILAGPLKEMAKELTPCLDDNAYVVLSGILHEQKEGVQHAYEAQGLTLKKLYKIGEWSTLVMHKA